MKKKKERHVNVTCNYIVLTSGVDYSWYVGLHGVRRAGVLFASMRTLFTTHTTYR